MKRYLVTGGAGFIGSHLVDALVARGDHVRVLDNLSTGRLANLERHRGQIEFLEGDVTDPARVGEAVRGVDCVFHQAALASVPRSIEFPLDTHAACATGTLVVLEQAQRAGVRRVVYAGSSSCYGDQPNSSKRESDPVSPLSPYAAAKLAGELYCQAFYQSYGLEAVTLRYFNVFGPRQDPNGAYAAVIPRFVTRILAGEPLIVFGDGQQSRDFTYVANIVEGNLLAAEAPQVGGKSFNLADGRSISLLELIAALESLVGERARVVHEPPRVGDVRESLADTTLARKQLGYRGQIDFRTGLRLSTDYYRAVAAASSR